MVLTDRQAQQSYSEEREPFNGAALFRCTAVFATVVQ